MPIRAEVVERILAVVNEETITLSEANDFQDRLKKKGLVDEALLKLTDRNKLAKDQRAVVEHLIFEKIMDSEVKKQDLEVTIEKVEREIRSIAKGNGLNRTQLKDALTAQGVSFSDYQDFVKKSLERRALIEKEITAKIRISDEEIAAFYASKYGPGENQIFEYSLAQIVVSKSKGRPAAEKKINSILDKLAKGGVFEELANQFSEDPGFSQGGWLGTFKENELNKEFQSAVKNMSEGQFSRVIELTSTFHILKLKKRALTANPALLARKQELQETLMAQEFDRRFRNWLQQRKENSFVRIN